MYLLKRTPAKAELARLYWPFFRYFFYLCNFQKRFSFVGNENIFSS